MYGYAYRYSARAGKLSFNPASLPNTQFYSDPTIQSSVNSNLCQSLDGSTDALNSDALLTAAASDTTGIVSFWAKPVDATPVAFESIVSFGDTNAVELLDFRMNPTGTLSAYCLVGGTDNWQLITNGAVFANNTWVHITVIQDGVSPVIYINGSLEASTFSSSADKTTWFSGATGLDNGRVGCRNINSAGNDKFANIDIDEFGLWSNSTAVTAASLYNSGAGKTLTDLTTVEQVGLVGYYTLNDYLDTSGNSNTLTAIGTPTDAIGKVQTEVIAGENVYTLGDLAPSSNDGTQTTLINEPIWNTTHITYATNDFINIDAVLTDIASSTQGTLSTWIKPVDATPTSAEFFITFGDANADSFIEIYISGTSGKFNAILRVAGVTQWHVQSDAVGFTSSVWGYASVQQDGILPVLYIDNVAIAQTTITSTDTTKWFNDVALLDVGRIGCRNKNSGGNTNFLNGDIQQVYISTDVKDAATRTQLYNNNQP